MSLNKSATRRLSLLAGSSLVAATLAATAFTGAALAPSQAYAYDECVPVAPTLSDGAGGVSDPTLNGATADTFTCTGATTYTTTGITYSSAGNLRANATGTMDVGAVGINLTGTGADTVTLSSTGALTGSTGPLVDLKAVNGAITGTTTTVTAAAGNAVLIGATGTGSVTYTATGTLTGTSGAILDIKTASGAITATTTGVIATTPGSTNAVRLESTGAGNITYSKTGTNAASTVNNDVAGATAAIAAISHGGNITVSVTSSLNPLQSQGGGVFGRLRGILAETSGAGSVTLNISGTRGVLASHIDGIAAVDIVAGTGGADINLTGQIGGRQLSIAPWMQNPFVDALAIRVASAAAVTIDNTDGLVIGAVDFSGVTAGGVTFDNFGNGPTVGAVQVRLPFGGRWVASGASVFSSQNDVLRMAGFRANTMEPGTTIDFSGGTDTLNMSGVLVTHGATISNLEAFNNSGAIHFGAEVAANTAAVSAPDGLADDVLSMAGTTFTGSGASHLYMDVVMSGVGQAGCATLTGVGDCLDLRDGTTAGSTVITINDASFDATLSGYLPEGITLVDVSGAGTTAASHFTLDLASTDGYVHPLYGPAFDRPGAFVYLFRYDAENQRHVVISQPRNRDLFDYAILSGAAHSIWYLTSETVIDRQTDLRDGAEGGSVWLRTAGEVTRRKQSTDFDGFDDTFTFDNSYKLYAGTIMGGMDLISGGGEAFDYVLGAQIGYVSSSFDMDESESSGRFTGATGGAYASLWSDWFFLDGTVNVNGLALDYKHPALDSKTTTYVNSVGANVESGVRAKLTDNTFIEPLAAVSWVRTSFEEISLLAGEVQPADAESLRGGLGLRLGATLPGESVSASYFVTGRGWYEAEGDGAVLVHNPGADLGFGDEFNGAFGEAELGVSVFNTANTLSGFATTGVKWKKGYSTVNLALGVRMAW